MAGFRKAKAEQAALKIGFYGPAGSGKTFTALLVAEGLANAAGRRVAFVDTERGTDFYVKKVPGRRVHPEAFDIDALYTRSLTEVVQAVRGLSPKEYGVVVLDSITHLWEAAQAAYTGGRNSAGQIPFHAWARIKKPYKDLMHALLNSPLHVLIRGRQGNEWGTDDATGETVQTGYKMKAESETAYEPHILIRMEARRPRDGKRVDKTAEAIPTAFVEKDRSGVLAGKLIEWPSFESLAAPLIGLLDDTQAQIEAEDDTAARDADALARAEQEKAKASAELRNEFDGRFKLAKDDAAVEAVAKDITPAVKRQMSKADVEAVRKFYTDAKARVSGGHVAASHQAEPGEAG
jgi:RecA/RadA recombinase